MRLRELLSAVPGAQLTGSGETDVASVEHDSRVVNPGSLFVCIRGFKQDGHAFIGDAARRGAAAAVVEDDPARLAIPPGLAVLRVANSRSALARLAAHFFAHPDRSLRLIGVTGTNGKTTTAYLVEAILRAAGHRVGLLGTIEYRCGATTFPGERTTPESSDLQRLLARMRDMGAWGAAMEVSSHSLMLHRVEACEFDIAVFTNLTQDHLDFHGTMERYAEAKARLFEGLGKDRVKPGIAAAILNADDPWAEFMARRTTGRVVRFSLGIETDVTVRTAQFDLAGIRAVVTSPWGRFEVTSSLVGRHNLANILGAAGACLHLGIPCRVVEAGIASLTAVPGRFEKVERGQPFGVVVDYAHTPDALERVLTFAREYTRARLIVVFGCGGDRDRTKRPRMGEVAARLADAVFVTSDNPRSEDPDAILREINAGIKKTFANGGGHANILDRREAIGAALASARGGDLVVIAGKGHESYQILRDRTIPFDDRVVAREALAALGYGAPGGGPVSGGR
jgi:UDP-N-acetylmuramoyl-L-alanyl-D-glutamate--2,6-diaminopimelate ligase